jgi:hypothetical protein
MPDSFVILNRNKYNPIHPITTGMNPLEGNLCKEEACAVQEYGDLSRAEESFFKQKSRVQWLNLWDYNTKLF